MADIADIANDDQLAHIERTLGAHAASAPVRRAEFCDCTSWEAGQQFCGDRACRDAYEAEDRRIALASGGRQATIHIQRGAR
jgi:hypothetical protein